MIYLYRTTDHFPIYSPWTGRLLTFSDGEAAADYIIRNGLAGQAYFIDPDAEAALARSTRSVPIDKRRRRS